MSMRFYDTPPVAGIYGRVSDNRKGKSASVPQQLDAGDKISREEGWNLQHRLEGDDGRRASRFSDDPREDWDRLIELTTEAKVQIWIFWECSRGSRRPVEWFTFLDLCRDNGILIYVITHERTYDPRIPRDWKILASEGVDAAYEVEMTSKRVGRDKSAKAASGIPDGKCPQGYERIYDSKTKALIEQRPSSYAWVIKEIFDLLERLTPVKRIEEDFRERGILTEAGKPWRRTSIIKTAKMAVYMGKRIYRDVTYDGTWEPIVQPAQWHTVNRILRDPKRQKTRAGKRKHMLSYWMMCGVCDAPVHVDPGKPRRQAPSYQCPNRHVAGEKTWVDDYVRDLILEWAAVPERYSRIARPDSDGELIRAENELQVLTGELDEYYGLARARQLTPTALAMMEAEYVPRIEAVKRQIQDLATPPPLRVLFANPKQDLKKTWEEDMSVAQRHGVVTWMFASMRLMPSTRPRGRLSAVEWQRLKYEWAH